MTHNAPGPMYTETKDSRIEYLEGYAGVLEVRIEQLETEIKRLDVEKKVLKEQLRVAQDMAEARND
jgi:hypothetical protein